jgi:maltose/maltodextrin transport system permease protein/arabinogalactan oligomer/maltooligosaccharide transport system permease protein
MIRTYIIKNSLKILLLGLLATVTIWVGITLVSGGHYLLALLLLIGTTGIAYVYLSKRAYPLRYLVPGLIFLFSMVVYPIGYNVYISFTNLSTGHLLSKDQAITQITGRFFTPPDAPTFSYDTFQNEEGDLALLLHGDKKDLLYYQDTLTPVSLPDDRFVDEDGDGKVDRFLSYQYLTISGIIQNLPIIERLRIPYMEHLIRLDSLREFKLAEHLYSYDPEENAIIDLQDGTVYHAMEGFFTADDGEEIYPGFKVWLGFRNYCSLLRNPAVSGPFGNVFLWTIAFATLSVVTTFILGLFLAILLNDPYLKFRRLYRVLAIVPYALPAFISILIWHGLLNTNLGIINHVLMQLFQLKIPWLENPMWARASILLVNLWLGYPYMMIVSLGALQSIPGELYEAARVDGAGWFYRFFKITLPLLLMPLAPLLIGSFAFNFNNFTIIWLLTEGGPPMIGAQTPAGSTDILLSYTYRLAFEGARGNQMGLAAAVSIIIFLIIATISAINFRFTGALEDLSKNV